MKLLQYTGTANRRVIEPADLFPVGFETTEVLEFDRDSVIFKGQSPVPDDVADWLVMHDSFEEVTEANVVPKFRKEFFGSEPELDFEPSESEKAQHEAAKALKEDFAAAERETEAQQEARAQEFEANAAAQAPAPKMRKGK